MSVRQEEIQTWIARKCVKETEMKKYWAAYMNMARNNLFVTLMSISRSVGDPEPIKGDNIESNIQNLGVLRRELTPEMEEKTKSLFFKHFPFLRALSVKEEQKEESGGAQIPTLQDLRNCITDFACTLGHYRNVNSHSIFIDKREDGVIERAQGSERRCGGYLQSILTVSTRTIKERYRAGKNSVQKGMIDEESFKFITDSKVRISYRGRDRITTPNERYYLNTFDKDGVHLSFFGKLMMTCLLLEKKYATELLTQCHFLDAFSGDAESPKLPERRLILEVMTALRIRLPERKLSIEKDEVQIALDILNELKKCPYELYDLLGDEDKSLFRIVSDTGDSVLLRWPDDRFPQLALSLLDSGRSFDRLRFQVNAGKLRYLFREEKRCVDGQTRMRVIEEPLNGFRRRGELEEERVRKQSEGSGLWLGLKILSQEDAPRNDASLLPYITDSRTRYILDGDNIGMSVGDFTPSIVKMDDVRYKVEGKVPDCYLSKYELPGLLFYHHLTRGHSNMNWKSAEQIIIDTIGHYRKLFSDVKNGVLVPSAGEGEKQLSARLMSSYGVALPDVPEKIADYLLERECGGVEKFKLWKQRILDSLIQDTEKRLEKLDDVSKRVRSSDNKPGKKNYVYYKPGGYASFVAEDIVFFQECGASEKLTGLNFKVLQSRMATFARGEATSMDILRQTFRNAGLISGTCGKGNHPFLYRVVSQSSQDIVDFYKLYLKEKKTYLISGIPDDATFLHRERAKWEDRDAQYYMNLAARYLERPIQLPRQMFERAIRAILLSSFIQGESGDMKSHIKEAFSNGRCNTAFMIMEYFNEYLNDGSQSFYGLFEGDLNHCQGYGFYSLIRNNLRTAKTLVKSRRGIDGASSNYARFLEEAVRSIKEVSVGSNDLGHKLPIEELSGKLKSAYKDMMNTEKRLRRYAVQDQVLFLEARRVIWTYWGIKDKENECLLGDIMPNGGSLLDLVMPYIETSYRVRSGNFGRMKEFEAKVRQENVSVKDYGKVFKLFNDRRVNDLLSLHGKESAKMDDICEELDRYDRHRVGVFGDILKYEDKITKGIPENDLVKDNGVVDFKVVQGYDYQNSEEDKIDIRVIRNAFAHNQYPQKKGSPVKYGVDMPEIADRISEIVKDIEEKTE